MIQFSISFFAGDLAWMRWANPYIIIEETADNFMGAFLYNINHVIFSVDPISRVIEGL